MLLVPAIPAFTKAAANAILLYYAWQLYQATAGASDGLGPYRRAAEML